MSVGLDLGEDSGAATELVQFLQATVLVGQFGLSLKEVPGCVWLGSHPREAGTALDLLGPWIRSDGTRPSLAPQV